VTIASPYAIWVLKQASDKLPVELDEAATMDGATTMQLFRLVYVPLMMPSLVAIGTYAILLAWNEYHYAFLLLSKDTEITLPVALGNFLAADDSPWELLMTTGFIYAAAGRDLLRVQAVYGRQVDGGRGQILRSR
jgi:multiple sugar transport system permease protein